MYIDYEEIEKLTGRRFSSVEELYLFVLRTLEFLKANNENYTEKQQEKIEEIFACIGSVKFEE